jgi:hypothetical protein
VSIWEALSARSGDDEYLMISTAMRVHAHGANPAGGQLAQAMGRAATATHGMRESPEVTECAVVERSERVHVGESRRIHRRHRVQAKKIQASHAQVHALDDPVVKARDARARSRRTRPC